MELLGTGNYCFLFQRLTALQQLSFALLQNTRRFAFIMLTYGWTSRFCINEFNALWLRCEPIYYHWLYYVEYLWWGRKHNYLYHKVLPLSP